MHDCNLGTVEPPGSELSPIDWEFEYHSGRRNAWSNDTCDGRTTTPKRHRCGCISRSYGRFVAVKAYVLALTATNRWTAGTALLRAFSRWRGQGINPGRDPSGVRRSRTHDENHLKEQLQRRTRCALILDLDLMATRTMQTQTPAARAAARKLPRASAGCATQKVCSTRFEHMHARGRARACAQIACCTPFA